MYVIGVDIGGTTIKGLLVNEELETIHKTIVPTRASLGKEIILSSLKEVIDELLQHSPELPGGIGIGSAGRINFQTGEVIYATENLHGWHGFPLKSWLENRYHLPAIVDNDANTALLGELILGGRLPAEQHTIMLTLGTGVGGANYFFGRMVRGAHHQSGEWGHTVLYPHGRSCNCGKQGCIEQYLSGSALKKEAERRTGRMFSKGEEIFQQWKSDMEIKAVVQQFINDLTLVVENISTSIDPDQVILGGGVVDSRDYWWPDLLRILKEREVKTQVKAASHMNVSGMYGAAYLALKQREESEGGL